MPQLPQPPLEKPYQQNSTPNVLDFVVVDEWTLDQLRAESRLDIAFGSPHPNSRDFSDYTFVWQAPAQPTVSVHRWWCKTRSGQEAYNARYSTQESANAFPSFSRSYFEPRIGYAALTKLAPLTSLTGLTLTAGGTGYLGDGDGSTPLIFTGGTGAGGATGVAEVRGGVIVAVLLTDGGSYTAVPTVTAEGGSDAIITAVLQPASCVLTKEEAQPEVEPYGSLFLRVTRLYETLPGPILAKSGFDPEDGALTVDYSQRVALPATPISLSRGKGVDYGSGYRIIASTVVPDEGIGAVVGTSVWKTKLLPAPTTALGLVGYTTAFPKEYATKVDTVTGIIVDEVKYVVPAGTLGSIVVNDAKNITAITTANPAKVTTEIAHRYTTGNSIIVAGATGGSGGLNAAHTIIVIDALNFTIGFNNAIAASGGTVHRADDPDAYIEISPATEMESVAVRSCVRLESVLGEDSWSSYPVSVQWQQPPVFTAPAYVESTDAVSDLGVTWDEVGLKEGEFQGWASDAYFTPAQLIAFFTSSYPAVAQKFGGGSSGIANAAFSATRVWTFHIPNEQFQDDTPTADFCPETWPVLHVRSDLINLGLARVTIIQGDIGL